MSNAPKCANMYHASNLHAAKFAKMREHAPPCVTCAKMRQSEPKCACTNMRKKMLNLFLTHFCCHSSYFIRFSAQFCYALRNSLNHIFAPKSQICLCNSTYFCWCFYIGGNDFLLFHKQNM